MPEQIKPTEIVLVVDRSGSMSSIKEDAEGGLNAFVKEQAELEGECHITLLQFDTEHEVVWNRVPVAEAPEYTLNPRGCTALRDAIAQGAALLRDGLSHAPEDSLGVLVIITDGLENSSQEISHEQLIEIMEDCKKQEWGVIYLGANQDAVKEGSKMSINTATAGTYTPQNVRQAYGSVSANVASYRSSGQTGDLYFSAEQRASMGGGFVAPDPGEITPDPDPVRSRVVTPVTSATTLSSTEAAEYLGVSRSTLVRMEDDGEGPRVYRFGAGGHRRYRRDDLDDFLEQSSS